MASYHHPSLSNDGSHHGGLARLASDNRARRVAAYAMDESGAVDGNAGGKADGGTGGKIRTSRRALMALNRKKTPYDRPASRQHSARSSSGSSITSRIVDSASRLISSSAAYLLSSLFKRRPLAISNGDNQPVLESPTEEEEVQDTLDAMGNHNELGQKDQQPAANGVPMERELDLAQVEYFLRQRILSREQVNRLTDILQNQGQASDDAEGLNRELRRQQEQPKKPESNGHPIHVARAYMESRPLGLAATVSALPEGVSELKLIAPQRLVEDSNWIAPRARNSAPTPVISRKRSSTLDADLGMMRRVRQKSMAQVSATPYSRSRLLTSPPQQSREVASRILETLEKLSPSPRGKSLEEELKAISKHPEDSPETLKATDKSKLVNEEPPVIFGQHGPLNSSSHIGAGILLAEPPGSPAIIPEKPKSFGSPAIIPDRMKGFRMSAAFEETNSDEETRVDGAESSIHHVPEIVPHMELAPGSDSSSSKSFSFTATKTTNENVNVLKSVSNQREPSITFSAPASPGSVFASSSSVSSTNAAASVSGSLLPGLSSSPSSPFPTHVQASKLPASTGLSRADATIAAIKEISVSATETVADTHARDADFTSLVAKSLVPEKVASPLPSSSAQSSPSSSAPSPPSLASSTVVTRAASPSVTQLASSPPLLVTPVSSMLVATSSTAAVAPAFVPPMPSATTAVSILVPTSASGLSTTVTKVAFNTLLPEEGKPVTSDSGEHRDGDNGTTMVAEAAGAEKVPDVEIMSMEPMSEEMDNSTVLPSSNLQISSTSAAASSLENAFPFSGTTSSAFTFATGASPTSSAAFLFGSQMVSSSSGQSFLFGAPTSSMPSSFATSSTMSPFPMGSTMSFGSASTGTTVAPILGITSSAFSAATSSTSSFSFMGSSSSTTSMPTSSTLFGFVAPSMSSGSSSTAFSFPSSSANTSLGTHMFAFGAGANTSLSAGSSFSGQPFGAAAQSSNAFPSTGASVSAPAFAFGASSTSTGTGSSFFSFPSSAPAFGSASPVPTFGSASSPTFGAVTSAPFGLMSTPAFGTQTAVSQPFGSQPSMPFGSQAFGSAPAFGAPVFGGQTSSSGAFGGTPTFGVSPSPASVFQFGGQSSASAQSPFPAVPAQNAFPPGVPTQGGFEFQGGFALGSTGGEKSGRKFIKAKRGNVKRAK